jgi:hypothetical protein
MKDKPTQPSRPEVWANGLLEKAAEDLQTEGAFLVGGLHLAGSSSPNTTLLLGELRKQQNETGESLIILTIKGIYNKLGALPELTANDALDGVVSELGDLRAVVTDAPCSLPPCLVCTLDLCPGTARCPDVVTVRMQARWDSLRVSKRKKKLALDPSKYRLADFDLVKNSKFRPNASLQSGNYATALRMHQLKRMHAFGSGLELTELPFHFFEAVYAAADLPSRFAAQRTSFFVGESRRFSLWRGLWSARVLRYAPESRYLREPFAELSLEQFYKKPSWFQCLGMLLFLRAKLAQKFSG